MATVLVFIFGKMRQIPMNDLGLSLMYLYELDDSKTAKYLAKIDEIISTTNVKLLMQPTVMALLNIMSVFSAMSKGSHLFWKRAFVLLENEIKIE